MVEFDWTDALNLEGCLTEEEIMVRDAARSYAQVPCYEHRILPSLQIVRLHISFTY